MMKKLSKRTIRGRKGFGQFRPSVEQLEFRALLAGNVTASVSGGNLTVRGDNANNCALVYQVSDGTYAVTGFTCDDGAAGTRINGTENGTFVASGVTGNISVDLRSGNDELAITNDVAGLIELLPEDFDLPPELADLDPPAAEGTLEVPRNLTINLGDGIDATAVVADVGGRGTINTGNQDDAVGIIDSEFGGGLSVSTGGGADLVGLLGVGIDGQLNIQTGDGNDDVGLFDAGVGSIVIGTGNGHDEVILEAFDVDFNLNVTTNGGNDLVEFFDFDLGTALFVSTGDGNDEVFGEDFDAGGFVTVLTGNGNDEAELLDFDATGVLIDTGAGNDGTPSGDSPITVFNAEIFFDRDGDDELDEGESLGPITVVTGKGIDLVNVEEVTAANVTVNSGSENDDVSVYNSFIGNNLTVIAGAGNDSVELEGGNGALLEVVNDLIIDLGAGNDLADLLDVIVGDDLTAILGAGNDDLFADGVNVEDVAFVDAGAGNDEVDIGGSTAGTLLHILMGAGNDILTIVFSSTAKAILRGGSGTDTLNSFLTDADTFDHREFEDVNFDVEEG